MFDYISGTITEINPAQVVLDNHGIGYHILISLQTYDQLHGAKDAKLYIWHMVREDDEALFGFFDKEERRIFTLLIGVSGIGPNTARVMLSSLSSEEIQAAILGSDVNKIKQIKGIGLKTAQKVIIELKDKITKGAGESAIPGVLPSTGKKDEAATALITLGFSKQSVEKVLDSLSKQEPDCTLEEMIKKALKML